jgi:hypothetical protein
MVLSKLEVIYLFQQYVNMIVECCYTNLLAILKMTPPRLFFVLDDSIFPSLITLLQMI